MRIILRRDDDGIVDEIVARGVDVHLERMDKGGWFLGIYPKGEPRGGGYLQTWLRRTGKRVDLRYGAVRLTRRELRDEQPTCADPGCGHPRKDHSGAREDDFVCTVADCPCEGWWKR